ncbi:hypothetical protein KEM54_000632, partial [Ascosphaera aggregata]
MSIPDYQRELPAAVAEESELQHQHTYEGTDIHLAEVITPETACTGNIPVRIAFEGCGHGMLDNIYASIKAKAESRGWHNGVDLVIIGGDFQAVRNPADLLCLSVPRRYSKLGDFPAYYSGTKKAPYLTIFVGGNHEASNYMQELYYGGWVAPNIYYLGAANVVRFAGLRIAGLSGIFAAYDYGRPHFERLPYNTNDQKSVYHVRQIDVRKLMQLQNQVDIVISHDWPRGIEHYGNARRLFNQKRGFKEDSESGRLGNPAANDLLRKLRPRIWLSAHLHVKFEAVVHHTRYDPLAVYLPHSAITAAREDAATAANQAASGLTDREAWMRKVEEIAEKEKQDSKKEDITEPAGSVEGKAPTEPVTEFATAEAEAAQKAKIQADTAKKISAWNNFHFVAEEQDSARVVRDDKDIDGGEAIANDEGNNYQVTWRKVETGEDGMSRVDAGVEKFQISHSKGAVSRDTNEEAEPRNPDVIDLDSSDMDSVKLAAHRPAEISDEMDSDYTMKEASTSSVNATTIDPGDIDLDVDEGLGDNKGGTITSTGSTQHATAQSVVAADTKIPLAVAVNPDEIDIDLDMDDSDLITAPLPVGNAATVHLAVRPHERPINSLQSAVQPPSASPQTKPFTDPFHVVRADGAVVAVNLPAGITNTVTQFTSLDKIDEGRPREFLKLLETRSMGFPLECTPSADNELTMKQPDFRLEYDPEWLAITKALASELSYGCEPDSPLPPDKGDVSYLPSITAARAWVEQNIVEKNRLAIPHNFTHTAPPITDFDDPEQIRIPMGMDVKDQPKEYTNPQTVAYCEMLEINNVFDISEEEREERRKKGPRPEVFYSRNQNKRNFNGPRGPGSDPWDNFRNNGGYRRS